jgi:hypothetical protein
MMIMNRTGTTTNDRARRDKRKKVRKRKGGNNSCNGEERRKKWTILWGENIPSSAKGMRRKEKDERNDKHNHNE